MRHCISNVVKVSQSFFFTLLQVAKNLANLIEDIHFRVETAFGDQVMMVFDFIFPEPVGKLRAAGWLSFKDDKIVKIKLFYDGRPFDNMKQKIFTNHPK